MEKISGQFINTTASESDYLLQKEWKITVDWDALVYIKWAERILEEAWEDIVHTRRK